MVCTALLLIVSLLQFDKIGCANRFIVISDFHLDTLYGTPQSAKGCRTNATAPTYGAYGCDSPAPLVLNAIDAAYAAAPDAAFVVVPGDLVRHDVNLIPVNGTAFVLQTVELMTTYMKGLFGSTAVLLPLYALYLTLGNNDVFPDYALQVPPPDATLQQLVLTWQEFLPPAARETFRIGGYYSYEVVTGLTLISLNTIIYHPAHIPNTTSMADPLGQFAWMETILSGLKQSGGKAYIYGHIPPILDSFAKNPQWMDQYVVRYANVVARFNDVVQAQIFAHLHSDEFRTFNPTLGITSPIYVVGPVAPVYNKDNPSFRIFDFDPTSKAILDYTVWYTNLSNSSSSLAPVWKPEYSLRQYYGINKPTNAVMQQLAVSFGTQDAQWNKYKAVVYAGGPVANCFSPCRTQIVCLLLSLRKSDYTACLIAANTTSPNGAADVYRNVWTMLPFALVSLVLASLL